MISDLFAGRKVLFYSCATGEYGSLYDERSESMLPLGSVNMSEYRQGSSTDRFLRRARNDSSS